MCLATEQGTEAAIYISHIPIYIYGSDMLNMRMLNTENNVADVVDAQCEIKIWKFHNAKIQSQVVSRVAPGCTGLIIIDLTNDSWAMQMVHPNQLARQSL